MLELARSPQNREELRFLYADTAISRTIVATSGIPADRIAALRRTFDATMEDAAFLAQVAETRMDITPMPGEKAR